MKCGQLTAQGFVLCVVFGSVVSSVWASPGDQDLIRERQNRLLEEQQRRLEELRSLPGKAAQPTPSQRPEDVRCFDISTIELKGADSLSASDRQALLKPFIGQCLGVSQLNALLKAITDLYLARGLVTSRAYLPQQDLSSGHLQVMVVEGRLESFRPDDSSGLSERELAMAFPGSAGQLLNLREIEQMVDQLNRLPSNQAQMELSPGEAVGGSRVLVRNAPQKPWRASLSRNNEGQRSTGEQQVNVGFEWDSPLGLADQLVLRGGHDVVSDHTQGSNNRVLYYNLPWGWWNFSYSYSENEYRSTARANSFAFKQTGDNQNHQMRAERVVHRDAVSKTALNVGIAHLRTNNYIEDTRLDASSNRLSEAQFGINHGRRLGRAFVNLDLGIQQGIGAFDAQDNGHPRPGEPVARYRKYSATLSFIQGFELLGERLSFSSLANGQRSEDVLFSSQRISLGGLASIRGFKDQSLSGDSGGYWRNDLRWSRPVTWPSLRPIVAEYGMGLGYDLGVIRNDRYNGDFHGRASSHSLELFARGEHLAASVTFARSLERPDALPDKEHPVYLRLDLFI
ncbi:ShlB/FhaC/HecB family hemolysin secretion/activation protein [Pseudomonas guariconensis]|uniref:ShlB/FhaC/HecB family hemolysin secretion/activation protein n=1 Tax=Pseudomonas TaxID=286 RepID=UPI0008A3157D|nr:MULTISPECIES: ShlB/FhaC/HecB family hemolysin secretion/activation protein [Pseudomonas]MDD2089140.1 ShlB/FhaC/HecB family hemolysin secretion/activation protein [Pseudomonas guariconensis]OFS72137.1 ShlB family hemolysin secretion/activation protein [Pseudomonas sp. HMSC08G10]